MKINLLPFCFLLIANLSVYSQRWAQQGETLSGIEENDCFGTSVSLSANGNIMAVGASEYLVPPGKGYVIVYQWNGSGWIQKGQTINGIEVEDAFGTAVSLNSAGNMLAIGSHMGDTTGYVKVYSWNGNKWSQKGAIIKGKVNYERFGQSVCLNADGTRLAVGAPGSISPGSVRIYEWDGSSWSQMGTDLSGDADNDRFGTSLSWNHEGSILAAGAPMFTGSETGIGLVRTYHYNGSQWIQLGADITGSAHGDYLGYSVSLDSAGTTLATGANLANLGGIEIGYVRVLSWDGSGWTQKGDDVPGESYSDNLGASVLISSDGNKVVAGAQSSYIMTIDWDGSAWTENRPRINMVSAGFSISMTPDANILALGETLPSGRTRVLKFCNDSYDTISTSACYIYTSPGGKIWDTSGTYNDTIANTSGCDSIITINLTIHNATDTAFSIAACQSYTSPGGKVWGQNGVFIDTILNAAGCDSILTIDLTIFETAYDTLTLTECVSYVSPSGKHTWTESGTYTDTVVTSKGCDSIVTFHLTINEVEISVEVSENELTSNATFSAYQWLDCNDNYSEIPGATRQVFSPSADGSYAVEVTASNGCVDTSFCYSIETSRIEKNNFGDALNVYPNPTEGKITIDLGGFYQNVTLKLTNTNGQVVLSANHGSGRTFECLVPGPSGSYLLNIRTKEGKEAVVKIIKK